MEEFRRSQGLYSRLAALEGDGRCRRAAVPTLPAELVQEVTRRHPGVNLELVDLALEENRSDHFLTLLASWAASESTEAGGLKSTPSLAKRGTIASRAA